MIRKAMSLFSGNAFGSLMLLVRNLLVARLVSVEDYGIAATFAISMAVVEMASALGLQQLIVQARDGENPALQAGLQGFNMLRGLFSAAALFLLAHPIAQFLGIAEVAWAYQLLALVPALRGLEHLDIYRLNRSMRFGPLILTRTLPPALSVLSLWPLFQLFGDYRVMLYSVMLQWVLVIVTSHLVAERRFQISFDRAVIRQGLSFGLPLLANSILLFCIFQGDKLIVGREMGMAVLAIFSMGVTLTLTPTLVTQNSEQQFFLPQLSAARDDPARFDQLAAAAMQTSLMTGTLLVAAIALVGGPFVALVLGEKYAPLIPLLVWMAMLQAMRAYKGGGVTAALARANTSNALIANIPRVALLSLAWSVAARGGDLLVIIWIGILGEFLGYVTSLVLVRVRLGVDLRPMIVPLMFTFWVFVAAGAYATRLNMLGTGFDPSVCFLLLLCAGLMASLQDFWAFLRTARSPQPAPSQGQPGA